MNKKRTAQSAFFNLRILITLVLCVVAACFLVSRPVLGFFRLESSTKGSPRTLTFAQRVAYQRAIEEVYWRHRIWPEERPDSKPSLDTVMSQAQLEKKVADELRNSQALEDQWQRPLTAEDLQAEMDRMAENTKQPEVLRELFAALGNDPFVVAECLARPVLSERLITSFAQGQPKGRLALSEAEANSQTQKIILANATYLLPTISVATTGCTPNTWTATSTTNLPNGRFHQTAVWTGSEMLVWAGSRSTGDRNTGKRYTPSTDSWTAISIINAPDARDQHTAVWTGSEMIIWGGINGASFFNTGGRYNPTTDSWTATSTINAPTPRYLHTAVWTGSQMIVWGGLDASGHLNTGGRYNPTTNTWIATSTIGAPAARAQHTAVWSGTQMIVWGGSGNAHFNTGAKYNPASNSWTATSTTNAPTARHLHTAVWTDSQMIIWGGSTPTGYLNTGGRYNPTSDSWTATSTIGAPAARAQHTAVWTGLEMIVWGGSNAVGLLDTGGRYNSGVNSWTTTNTINAPEARSAHTAVWTGTEMIIFAGQSASGVLNTGGRYCAESPSILANISTRAFVQTGDNVMIGGFIIQGTQPKTVIVRGIGPELGLPPFNIPNSLANPTLTLFSGQNLIASNDNWGSTIIGGVITADQVTAIQTSGHAPTQPSESAIIATLQPGNYTAIVRGVNNTTGVGLVEVYDLGTGTGSVLGNISTRSFVQTGDDVMIGGFIIQGTQPKTVIVRGIGPELGLPPFNIPNSLANPTLTLFSGQNLIASNDNWQSTIIGGIITSNQVSAIQSSGHAPTQPSESAIIGTLQPGNYTAIVRGVNNTTGVGLVEVYDLDQ